MEGEEGISRKKDEGIEKGKGRKGVGDSAEGGGRGGGERRLKKPERGEEGGNEARGREGVGGMHIKASPLLGEDES